MRDTHQPEAVELGGEVEPQRSEASFDELEVKALPSDAAALKALGVEHAPMLVMECE